MKQKRKKQNKQKDVHGHTHRYKQLVFLRRLELISYMDVRLHTALSCPILFSGSVLSRVTSFKTVVSFILYANAKAESK